MSNHSSGETKQKIGLLSFQYSNNYGALLQIFALNKFLKKSGFEVEIINKYPDFELPRWTLKIYLYRLIKNIFEFHYSQFRNRFLSNLSHKVFHQNELPNLVKDKAAVIVGSDQVWRSDYTIGHGLTYFLDFVPDEIPKIAYAASFGKEELGLTNEMSDAIRQLLSRFSAVSVRETSGVAICRNEFGVEASHVLDPTLLLSISDYNEILHSAKNIRTPFITCYFLDYSEHKEQIVSELANKFSLRIRNINRSSRKDFSLSSFDFKLNKYIYPSFPSWLAGIKNADYVLTDSFHGVVFSILFNKQFVCFGNEERGGARFVSLLSQFGLMSRLCKVPDINTLSALCLDRIDYVAVNKLLDEKREESKKFILSAILKREHKL